ncbi:hypothetical protein ATK74_1796 [Propionicimonas paludicola]|uniref:Uncharacterized protein n=1 Tax=Propionicimonas paludicola TaxID=185243 RepID=A0A2A9CS27_9ACTN|nr:hypothetical protein [Propionicimonas paludicola]PFG17233.1 hypothetical protein ATK74_1796 [Propionicimonas paludicola]
MKRFRSSFVSVDIDVADVIDEIDDDDLMEEVKSRGLAVQASLANPQPLADLVKQFHDREHRGPLACCAYEMCDAVYRLELAEQLAERPELPKLAKAS